VESIKALDLFTVAATLGVIRHLFQNHQSVQALMCKAHKR
jgi:hypothetical protein